MANYKIKNDLILGNKVESNTSRAGTNCYYWDAIDFENMQIHILDGQQPGINNHPFPIITNDLYEAGVIIGTGPAGLSPEELEGQEFSITNGEHYYRFGRVTHCDGIEVIEFEFVNGHVFDFIVTYDNPDNIHGLSYSLVFNDLPEKGDHTVGTSARAYGEETKSYASNSTAMGKYTEAYGNGSIATGKLTKAIGSYSASFGFNTEAQGHHAFSSGKLTKALGNSSFASGSDTIARGSYSFTGGYGAEAEETAFAFGYYSKALAPYSFASGFGTRVELDEASSVGSRGASAIGVSTVAKGYAAHAQGISTQALAQGSFAAGRASIAEGKYSTAIGDGSKTSADAINSFAFGKGCIAYGNNAIAGGNGSNARRDAVAIGHNCVSDEHGVAFGYNTNVASHSYGLGRNCKTTCNYQVAVGVNNSVSDDMLFMIGNGADWDTQPSDGTSVPLASRQNAFTVYKNGDAKITGDFIAKGNKIQLGNTSVTEKQLKDLLELLKMNSILGTWQLLDTVTLPNEMTSIGAEMEFTMVFEEGMAFSRIEINSSGVYYYDAFDNIEQAAYDDGSTILGYSRLNITTEENISPAFKEWLFKNATRVE